MKQSMTISRWVFWNARYTVSVVYFSHISFSQNSISPNTTKPLTSLGSMIWRAAELKSRQMISKIRTVSETNLWKMFFIFHGLWSKKTATAAQHKRSSHLCLHTAHFFTMHVPNELLASPKHTVFTLHYQKLGHRWRQQCSLPATYTLGTQSRKNDLLTTRVSPPLMPPAASG